ncbi:hypothetical protein FE391_08255 [Nonomuraea sp. KC401]|uniref:hypothetical protein n=1 Tax=unclassified Nonomuraea TaxID=2593643 RepID=UPI0010FEDEA9|nr:MULTISPECIES: hypothetical protein [unclassified Nonomuraea]NBE93935.1 hypothetical protein [Nonomuraea sp. K271]TLF80193.1 hypothetical protein FE391_08255 [Nonomuraea sp. KC401]
MDVEELTGLVVATADSKDPLVEGAVAQIRAEMERTEAVLVRRACNNDATWVEIAAALGMSKQTVHRKCRGRRVFGDRS